MNKKPKQQRWKLNAAERQLVQSRRKFIKVVNDSKRLTSFRKAAKQSNGEKRVANFLKEQGVEFHREWYFKGLYNYSKSCFLYFDFYVPGFNLCIEYDGQQHYQQTKTGAAMKNDFLKNAYCAKNNIHLLRIKYTDFDNIELRICEKLDKIAPTERK